MNVPGGDFIRTRADLDSGLDGLRVTRQRMRDEIADVLKKAIIQGALRPGTRIYEQGVVQNLGVSRTPVREALVKLEHEGLVTNDTRKGAVVAGISKKDLSEIYPIVGALESLAASMAVPRIGSKELSTLRDLNERMAKLAQAGRSTEFMEVNIRFHESFLLRSQNKRLCDLIFGGSFQLAHYRTVSLVSRERMLESVKEHEKIIDAFARKDPRAVESLVKQHIESGREAVEEAFDQRKRL